MLMLFLYVVTKIIIKKLQTFDLSFFLDKNFVGDDGFSKYVC